MQQGSNHGNPVNRNHPWKQPPTGTITMKRISVENTYQTITQDPDQRGWEGRDRNLPRFAAKTRQVFGKKKTVKRVTVVTTVKPLLSLPSQISPLPLIAPPPFRGRKLISPPLYLAPTPSPPLIILR